MNIQKSANWTPSQWYNSETYQVSYKRNYKAASSTIVAMLGDFKQQSKPKFDKRFSVIRDPYDRALSIYKQLIAMGKIKTRGLHGFSDYLEHTIKEGFFDKHQFPQWLWLKDQEIKLFRLQNMPAIVRFIGFKGPIPYLNKRNSDIDLSYKDKKMIDFIYKKDINLFDSI